MKRITYVLALGLFATGALATAQESVSSSQPVATFVASINDYVAMHRRLEKISGPITLGSSVESINRSIEALAAAIRIERSQALQGDLFTPALAREFRVRISDALLDHPPTAAEVIASQPAHGFDPYAAVLKVNATFPWVLAAATLPCIVAALPPLPSELQYRIVGNDLVLVDVHASLVVDILPNALGSSDVPIAWPQR